jgi:hypothetical protein
MIGDLILVILPLGMRLITNLTWYISQFFPCLKHLFLGQYPIINYILALS